MSSIDDLRSTSPASSIATSERYAQDRRAVEDFFRTFFVPKAGLATLANQLVLRNLVPQHTAVALLLGLTLKKSWALMEVPPDYFTQRTVSPYLIASFSSDDLIDTAIARINHLRQGATPEVQTQADTLVQTLQEIKRDHDLSDHIFALMNQFLHA